MPDVSILNTATSRDSFDGGTWYQRVDDGSLAARCLVLCIAQEGVGSNTPVITWGDQTLSRDTDYTNTVGAGGGLNRIDVFYLIDTNIKSSNGSGISITAGGNEWTASAITFDYVDQSSPLNDSLAQNEHSSTNAATPNPITDVYVSVNSGEYMLAFSSCGNGTTASWTNATEATDQIGSSSASSLAYTYQTGTGVLNPQCTWASQNRQQLLGFKVQNVGATINYISSTEFRDGETITVSGIFGSSGNIDMADGSTWSIATNERQEIVSRTSDTIQFLVDASGGVGYGTRYIFAVDETSSPTTVSTGQEVLVRRKRAFGLSPSDYIGPSGTGFTTSQLTGGSGVFESGYITDYQMPLPTGDWSDGIQTELEVCLVPLADAVVGDQYVFQWRDSDGSEFETYTDPLKLTIEEISLLLYGGEVSSQIFKSCIVRG